MVLLSVAAWSCCRCIWHLMNEGPAWAFQTGEMWLQTMVGGIFQISPTVGISTFYLTAYFLVEKDDFPTTPFAHWFAWPKLVKSVSRVDDEQPTNALTGVLPQAQNWWTVSHCEQWTANVMCLAMPKCTQRPHTPPSQSQVGSPLPILKQNRFLLVQC